MTNETKHTLLSEAQLLDYLEMPQNKWKRSDDTFILLFLLHTYETSFGGLHDLFLNLVEFYVTITQAIVPIYHYHFLGAVRVALICILFSPFLRMV